MVRCLLMIGLIVCAIGAQTIPKYNYMNTVSPTMFVDSNAFKAAAK